MLFAYQQSFALLQISSENLRISVGVLLFSQQSISVNLLSFHVFSIRICFVYGGYI